MPKESVSTDKNIFDNMTTLATTPALFPQTYFKTRLEIQRRALATNPAVTAIQTSATIISAAATAALA